LGVRDEVVIGVGWGCEGKGKGFDWGTCMQRAGTTRAVVVM